jgi:hypothetical protein
MTTKQTRKPRQSTIPAEEVALENKLEALTKAIGDKEPTETQKKQRAELREQMSSLRFVRMAKKRVGKAVTMIRNVGKLTGGNYRSTPEQVKKIADLLTVEVKTAIAKLETTKEKKAEAVSIDL